MLSEKLEKLITAKKAIKEALIQKGMDADTSYENYATAIENISGGGDFSSLISVEETGDILSSENIVNNYDALPTVTLSNTTIIADYTLRQALIRSVVGPGVVTIGANAFLECFPLKNADFPIVETISDNAFRDCQNLESINFPMCRLIGPGAFSTASLLTDISFPMAENISRSAFYGCSYISRAFFPNLINLSSRAFYNNYRLLSLYMIGDSVAKLESVAALGLTPISGFTGYTDGVMGSIFVKMSLLDLWKTSTNWVNYSDRFVGLTDKQIDNLLNPEEPDPEEPEEPEEPDTKEKYQYIRFKIDEIWGELENRDNVVMQMGEIVFYDAGKNRFIYPDNLNISIKQNGLYRDKSQDPYGEDVGCLVDNNIRTKWCPNNCVTPLEVFIDLGSSIFDPDIFDRWSWYTGNDTDSCPDRNPKKMSVSISTDGINYVDYGSYESDESPAFYITEIGPFNKL